MKKFLTITGVIAAVAAVWAAAVVHGQQEQRKNGVTFDSADKAEFKEVVPGVTRAVLWGDPETGPYGAFTKFAPGFDAGMHTHTNDVWIVGIKGAYVYRDDAGEKRVGPGDFIRIPGGSKHWSGGDEQEGALFYEESAGRFDLIATEEASSQ